MALTPHQRALRYDDDEIVEAVVQDGIILHLACDHLPPPSGNPQRPEIEEIQESTRPAG